MTDDNNLKEVKNYLKKLFLHLWDEGEGFNSKRPFGRSYWKGEVYELLIKHGVVDGKLDENGYLEEIDYQKADDIIENLIKELWK